MSRPKVPREIKELAKVIQANPGCVAVVDNDWWGLYPAGFKQGDERDELASSSTHGAMDSGYGSGCCYGGDLLQALASIVGITVESV